MPSALSSSRDFMRRAVSRVRSGFDEYERRTKSPGPEIAVEPFGAGNVSTPAALIKLGTSIAAARRRKANLDAAQGDIELEREKNRAEIARIRAQTQHFARPDAGRAPEPVIAQGRYKGWTLGDAGVDQRERGLDAAAGRGAERNKRAGRVSAARARLSEIDNQVERRAAVVTQARMAEFDKLIADIGGPDEQRRNDALTAIGVDPKVWKDTPIDRGFLVAHARDGLVARTKERTVLEAQKVYEPLRQSAQATIDEGIEGFLNDPGDPAVGDGEVIDLVDDGRGGFVPAPRP